MTSSVHFRFKSAREFEILPFEGDFLKVADLKVAIVARKKLNFGEGFDLEISDAATSDVYHDESALVQKNTSVIVRRIPGLKPGGILSHQDMASKNERYADKPSATELAAASAAALDSSAPANDLPKTIEGADEAERINSLINQASNAVVDLFPPPSYRGRHPGRPPYRSARGRGARAPRGGRGGFQGPSPNSFGGGSNVYPDRAPRPSANYVCHRCNQPGHWIDQCPTNGDPTYDKIKVRAPTGIPRSMLRQVDAPESGTGLQDSSGQFVTLQPNEEEFARQTVGLRLSQAAAAAIGNDANPIGDPASKPETGVAASSRDPSASPTELPPSDSSVKFTTPTPAETPSTEKVKSLADVGHDGTSHPPEDTSKVAKENGTADNTVDPNPPKANGIYPGAGVGSARHVNKNNAQARRGSNPQRGGMRLRGMPMPGAPPSGFPPMGMPPFPPGMPPPPPHILMAMAAAANGHGTMPPGLVPPNMPLPFPAPVGNINAGNGSNNPSAADQHAFQQFLAMMHGQAPHANIESDRQNGSSDKDREHSQQNEKPGRNGDEEENSDPRPGMNVSDSQGVAMAKENEGVAADLVRGRGLEQHATSERIESSPKSKSDSHLCGGRSDGRRETDERRKRDSYENDKEEPPVPRHIQDSRFSRRPHTLHHSPRVRSPQRYRRSPVRERHHSPLRRRDRNPRDGPRSEFPRDSDVLMRGRGYEERGRRELRRGREETMSPEPHANGADESRIRHQSPRDRMHRRSRGQSPSPSRGKRDDFVRPPRDPGRRGMSPTGRDRYSDQRDGIPPGPPRTRRERFRDYPSPRGRLDKRERRYRSRSPPDVSRYDRLYREREPYRHRRYDQSRASRSPVRLNGEPEGIRLDNDSLRRRTQRDDREDFKRRRVLRVNGSERPLEFAEPEINVRMERKDSEMQMSEAEKKPPESNKDSNRPVEMREQSPRKDRVQGDDRSRLDGEASALEGRRSPKRSRRDWTPEDREGSREEQRDRRSVHERLGQPRDKRRGRRSVHDRLG